MDDEEVAVGGGDVILERGTVAAVPHVEDSEERVVDAGFREVLGLPVEKFRLPGPDQLQLADVSAGRPPP